MRALLDLVPGADVVYFGDTGRFPYGPKPADEVLKYALEIVDLLLEHDVRMVVVACNSAAAAALDQLRERLDIPVVGVIEPGLRAARRVTRHRSRRCDRHGRHDRVGCVPARRGRSSTPSSSSRARRARDSSSSSSRATSTPIRCTCSPSACSRRCKQACVDTLVLGCTHYPLLARTIADVMGPDVVLVSSADETAFEVRAELDEPDRDARDAAAPRRVKFMTSGDPATFRELGARFLGPEVEHVEAWSWS